MNSTIILFLFCFALPTFANLFKKMDSVVLMRPNSPIGQFPGIDGANDFSCTAYLGDLAHKRTVMLLLWTRNNNEHQIYISAKAQRAWLTEHHPELVPPNAPDGTPPNDHSVAQMFEFFYTQGWFEKEYTEWLYKDVAARKSNV